MKITDEVITYLNNKNTFTLGVKLLCKDNDLESILNPDTIGIWFNIHSSKINHRFIYHSLKRIHPNLRNYRVCVRDDEQFVYIFFNDGDKDEQWVKNTF